MPGAVPATGRAGGCRAGPDAAAQLIAAHASAARTVGVLLVRLGGYAAGVFSGTPPTLADSKVGSRLVHGRSAAGGQSQQRFARRREKQAAEALAAAADTAAMVFGRQAQPLDAVVLGGDRRAIAALQDDPRLRPYLSLAVDRFLTVPDPRLTVLRDTPAAVPRRPHPPHRAPAHRMSGLPDERSAVRLPAIGPADRAPRTGNAFGAGPRARGALAARPLRASLLA